jgi:hypothetical protein
VRQAFEYGRYDGLLYRRYRERGMARVKIANDLRRILVLLSRLPFDQSAVSRAKRLRAVANRVGIIIGRLRGAGAAER